MDNFFVRSIRKYKVISIFISTVLAGVTTAFIKCVLNNVAALRYKQSVIAGKTLCKYRFPLLRAADSLDQRLENIIRSIEEMYEAPQDDSYRLSTLYLFGSFLGLCKTLENAACREFKTSERRTCEFLKCFYRVFKALTCFGYFWGLDEREIEGIEQATVTRHTLTAIGELMLEKSSEDKDQMSNLLGFTEFSMRLKESPEFRKWFGYLEKGIFPYHKPSKSSAQWNRILVVASILRTFITFLDPKSQQTMPRKIHYLKRMNPKVAERVREQLREMKMLTLIAT